MQHRLPGSHYVFDSSPNLLFDVSAHMQSPKACVDVDGPVAEDGLHEPGGDDVMQWRRKIDAVNQELLRLLERRGELALQIVRLKRDRGLPARDAERERRMLADLLRHSGWLYEPGEIEGIFQQVFAASRALALRALTARAGTECLEQCHGSPASAESSSHPDRVL